MLEQASECPFFLRLSNISPCFDYWRFAVSFDIGMCEFSRSVLFQDCLAPGPHGNPLSPHPSRQVGTPVPRASQKQQAGGPTQGHSSAKTRTPC